MYELEESFIKPYMESKVEYDTLSQAIKIAKESGVEDKHIQKIMNKKKAMKAAMSESNTVIIKKLQASNTSIAKVKDGWFAIKYINDKNETSVVVDILLTKDIHFLEIEPRRRRDYSKSELDTLLPGYIDEIALEAYKVKLHKRAKQLIFDNTGINLIDDVKIKEGILRVSTHAIKRWIQRVLWITQEIKAEEYRKLHYLEIEAGILQNIKGAELLWEGQEDKVQYWFDDYNIVYVVSNSTIITVYEEMFGFTKNMNRSIVFQQIDVIKEGQDALAEAERICEEQSVSLNEELMSLSDQVKMLESSIEVLKAKQASVMTKRDEYLKQVRMERDNFNAEFNKLFKKSEV